MTSKSPENMSQKTAIVTGGSRGLPAIGIHSGRSGGREHP
jgi:hypothetical protein